jgi:hypothetical protein
VLQETYLHRIGRTARAGAAGRALTFVEDQDRALLKQVLCCGDIRLVGDHPWVMLLCGLDLQAASTDPHQRSLQVACS